MHRYSDEFKQTANIVYAFMNIVPIVHMYINSDTLINCDAGTLLMSCILTLYPNYNHPEEILSPI